MAVEADDLAFVFAAGHEAVVGDQLEGFVHEVVEGMLTRIVEDHDAFAVVHEDGAAEVLVDGPDEHALVSELAEDVGHGRLSRTGVWGPHVVDHALDGRLQELVDDE